MKSYPSIPKDINTDHNIYAFDKLDGSNIRAEWSPKRGFYKFGTKTQMLGEDHPIFGEAIGLIQQKYATELAAIFQQQKYENAVCFFEFLSPGSFAGYHPLGETRDVVILDVSPHKKGILPPQEFLRLFGHLHIPKLLYYGKANEPFVESVRNSTLEGMTFEGVICKAAGTKKHPMPIMFKVKSRAWLSKLKDFCKEDEALFTQLA
jgi:hypothetical protein